MPKKPEGYSSASSYLVVDGARSVIMHAELRIDDTGGEWPAIPSWLPVYMPDVDATYRRALEAGGVSVAAGEGPAGNTCWIATQAESS